MSVPLWAFAATCMAGALAAMVAICLWWDLDAAERRIADLERGNRNANQRLGDMAKLLKEERAEHTSFLRSSIGSQADVVVDDTQMELYRN